MTIINRFCVGEANMDTSISPTKEESGKSSRPIRSKRYTRRTLVAGQRPQKKLFTPEIKQYLKDWLVRRRDNPYPNREEKKYLSRETGLTYIQICNWFANWRRKLKNVNEERNQQTWSHLIRTYNDRAQGNVEHFSICSEDSIWSEPEPISPSHDTVDTDTGFRGSPDNATIYQQDDSDSSSTSKNKNEYFDNNTFDAVTRSNGNFEETKNITSPLLLSKWLESAARFQPSETNYSWWPDGMRRKTVLKLQNIVNSHHDRDEVEAAVALTALANAATQVIAQ